MLEALGVLTSTSMDQRKRRKLLQEKLSEASSSLGFTHLIKEYFVRDRGNLRDVFFFQQTRNNTQYYVAYGLDCPSLLPFLRNNGVLVTENLPRLLIDNGRLENSQTYGCKYEEHIESSVLKVVAALLKEGEPWFSCFQSTKDVIEQYRKSNIGLRSPSRDVPAGKIIRWCQYGLMLLEDGNEAGRKWLKPVLASYKARPRLTKQDEEWVRIVESYNP